MSRDLISAPHLAVDVRNELGEGIVWHPDRQQLLWFDIYRKCAFLADADGTNVTAYGFSMPVSAAFIVNRDSVLVASSSGLLSLDLTTGETNVVQEIEANNLDTLSNDCRAAPGNSLWFGTRSDDLEAGDGAIYHYRNGELTVLYKDRNCPNSICFSPEGDRAYFSDTFDHKIMTCAVDPGTGLPDSSPDVFVDLTSEVACPDGAVVDSEGCLWSAHFGAGRVARYRPDGSFDRSIDFPAPQTTCPCLGGPDLTTLYVTSANGWMSPEAAAKYPLSGAVFAVEVDVPGLPERTITCAQTSG